MQTLDLHKKDDSFKPTREELDTIRRKMDDPEFLKLWAEYAKDLQDPKYRAEEEAYLKQVEREAREGGDYSFEFVFPEPAFAARLLNDRKKQTTFLNICSSEKVDEFSESRIANSRDASWQVPIVVGQPHDEDYEGTRVQVYDCVFHPKTVGLANKSDKFMCFVIEIAIENINEGFKQGFGFEFQRLQMKCVGTPKNQTIRKKGNEPTFPKATGPISVKPTPPAPPVPPAAPPTSSTTAPSYTVLHRGQIDLTDAWNWQKSEKRIGIPKELVVKFELPKVERASALEVDVLGHSVSLVAAEARYEVTVALPFTVDETPVEARFDKTRRSLQLVLSVIPPQAPRLPEEAPKDEPAVDECDEPSPARPTTETVIPPRPALESVAPAEIKSDDKAGESPGPGIKSDAKEIEVPVAIESPAQSVLDRVVAARRAREAAEQEAPKIEETLETQSPAPEPNSKPPEVIDLRTKNAAPTAASGPVVVDDDVPDPQEVLAAQKKLRAAREADKAAATLAQKMSELPLCSRHIFAID